MVVESEYYGTKVEGLTLTYKVKSATPQDSAFSGYVRYDNQNQDIAGDSKITFATTGSGCMPGWVLDDAWSECVGNVQYKSYHDTNNCGLAPPESSSQPCASTPPAPQEATTASSPDATNNANNAIITPPSGNNPPATYVSAIVQEGQAVLAQQTYSGYGESCNTDTNSCESSLSCKRDLTSSNSNSNSICCKPNECAANGACPPEYSCSSTPKKLCYNGGWIDVLNYEVNCVDGIDNDCDGKIDTQDSDCPPVCGNKICETSEDKTSCPGDCGGDRYIIIRSDDIAPLWSTDNSIYLTEYIRSMSIPQTLGVIPLSDQGTIKLEDDIKLVSYLVSIKNDPLIEIGLHGLDHSIDEFQGIGQTVSFSKINDGKNIMKNAISIDPTTFLPPYFSYDEDTLYGARNAGIKIFSAGWNAVDMGHAFREYPAGLFNIPATTDIYNWDTEVLYSAEEIESSCENAITRFGTCVIVIHHHSFVDESNNIDPDKIAVLTDVLLWTKSQEAKGVKLRTLGAKDTGGINDNIAPLVIIDSPLNITYDVKTVLFSARSNETAKEMRESIDGGAPVTVCTQCMSFAHNITLANGHHSITAYALDNANNAGHASVSFTVDYCDPNWVLNSTWSACINNVQRKNYYATNICSKTGPKPSDVTKNCDALPPALEVYRTLPRNASIGQEFDVSLFIDVNETRKPRLYVLYETIPQGFSIVNTGGMQYTNSTRTLKLMAFESRYFGTAIQDRTITYRIKLLSVPPMPFGGYITLNGGSHNTLGDSWISVGGG